MILTCVCGKICTSRVGVSLHHKNCNIARKSIENGEAGYCMSNSGDGISTPELKELIGLAECVAIDGDMAINQGNKSAGRRARVNLLKIRDMIIPIMKRIHDRMTECKK